MVADTRVRGLRNESPAIAATALSQGMDIPVFNAPTLLIRSTGALPDLASRFKEIHSSLQFEGGGFATEQLRGQLRQERTLALLGLLWRTRSSACCNRLFGNMSYVLARRKAEIGVRLALGAQPRKLVAMVLREYLLVVAAGLASGIAASLRSPLVAPIPVWRGAV